MRNSPASSLDCVEFTGCNEVDNRGNVALQHLGNVRQRQVDVVLHGSSMVTVTAVVSAGPIRCGKLARSPSVAETMVAKEQT